MSVNTEPEAKFREEADGDGLRLQGNVFAAQEAVPTELYVTQAAEANDDKKSAQEDIESEV
ncbi:hypothetical protein PSCICF_19380 [Pseudomonas cichorii]|nr:hypothetical protein [Pseudomonas cichorii]GFM55760.1 hypothetical protein PSCICF_19380 [Pseudomonas cichorii]GFM62027.1 hypothetical protein PSCICG_31870 [Pseudomonas cichorii]